jgi:hypothetical protein
MKMNNIRQPAEPKPEIVECAIVELLEIAERHGITPADFIQLLHSGMHISDFLAAMTEHYCWVCGDKVSLETCRVDEQGRAVHEACLFARMKIETASSCFGASRASRDRGSFEKYRATFAVQESELDSQSLSALVELQHSITTGETDLDRAMQMVADRSRNVTNATGVAVALLKGDQLVYRAGSGSAAAYVGRRVTAVLSVSVHDDKRDEILRVENAQADTRIEASVCRLFGANALLIVPIYQEGGMAGVLEVFFSEAHTFQDQEVRTYRVMARLVEEAMFRDARLHQEKALEAQLTTVPHATQPTGQTGFCRPVKAATTITQPAKRVAWDKLRWNVAVVVGTMLVMVSWIAYDHPASPTDASSLQRSNAAEQQAPAKLSRGSNGTSKPQAVAGATEGIKAAGSAFKLVRVGQNEVDYIAEDVTIRRFTPKPRHRPQMGVGEKRVDFGEDVTVRYFASKPPVASQAQPVSGAARSVGRSLLDRLSK